MQKAQISKRRSASATLILLSGLLVLTASSLAAQKAPDVGPYLMADRAAEIELARTAAPSDISSKASVLVLTPTGYVEAVHGTNGFTCAVLRSFTASPDDPHFWNPPTVGPACLNPPAVRTVLPELLAQTEWALAGATPAQLTAKITAGYASHTFSMPANGAMAYMLSPRQHLSDSNPHWMPHVMFYYERSLGASTFGAGGENAPIVYDGDSTPVQLIFIPTRAWSDGTPATGNMAGH